VSAARTPAAPEPEAPTSGFSEEQRSELRQLIAEAVGSATPPKAATPEKAAGPKQVSDSEWDAMSDRQRESWVRQLVDFRLDELARDDEFARQRADIDALKADKTPEPEAPPSVVSKIQKFLWGEPER
jgi:hypothetical protein